MVRGGGGIGRFSLMVSFYAKDGREAMIFKAL